METEDIAMETESIKKETQVSRTKHKCPLPDCKSEVVHLPRHMRQIHGWKKDRAKAVLNTFNLRTNKPSTSGKKARVFKRKICPFRNCNGIVKRIHNHLTDVHHLKRNSKTYRLCLNAAVPEKLPVISESSEDDITSEDNNTSDYSDNSTKQHKRPSIFNEVYGSDEESDDQHDWASVIPVEELNTNDCDDGSDKKDDEDSVSESNTSNSSLKNNSEPAVLSSKDGKRILSSFQEWLKGPDGGRKDDKCANQCMRQIQMVIEFIENPSITLLMSKCTMRDK